MVINPYPLAIFEKKYALEFFANWTRLLFQVISNDNSDLRPGPLTTICTLLLPHYAYWEPELGTEVGMPWFYKLPQLDAAWWKQTWHGKFLSFKNCVLQAYKSTNVAFTCKSQSFFFILLFWDKL